MPGNVRAYLLLLLILAMVLWLAVGVGGGAVVGARFFGVGSTDLFSAWSRQKIGTLLDTPCAFEFPSGVDGACYRFVVPQNWFVDDGRKLGLAVAVVRMDGGSGKSPPVVYLEGGPGGSVVPDAASTRRDNKWITEDFAPVFAAGRALVLLDGRGVGASRPFLSCPEAMKQIWRDFRMPPAKRSLSVYLDEVEKCLVRLSAQGVDLAAYNSEQFAQDLKHLREALGYHNWALYGVSYGAETALAAIRADGPNIERVIFDSPSYARGDVWNQDQDAFDRVLMVLDKACDSGEICSPGQRDLTGRLRAMYHHLNQTPLLVRRTGGFLPVYMDGYLALFGVHLLLYYDVGPQMLWSVIRDLERGDEGQARFLVDIVYDQYAPTGFSDVVNWATSCQESDVFSPYTRVSDLPVYDSQDVQAFRKVCGFMGLTFTPNGMVSDLFPNIPVIVFSGAWDPITPPSYGAALARDLGAVAHVIRPRAAHSAAFKHEDACAQEILTAFLRSPDGDAVPDCVR